MSKSILTQSRLRELFDYNSETGVFTRIALSGRRAKLTDRVGTPDGLGYLRVSVDNVKERLHRLAFLYMTRVLPEHKVDHLNRNRSDNRWANLRVVSDLHNTHNRGVSTNNWTGTTGVSWNPIASNWRVRIRAAGRNIHVGNFAQMSEAVRACIAAKQLYHPTAPVA